MLTPYGALVLAALRADQAYGVRTLTEATTRDAMSRGEGIGITVAEWANAMLNNGIVQLRQGDDHRAARCRNMPQTSACRLGERSS